MKILRLDLLAFGHFTNVELDLSADAETIHLIYGSNEAGKSTALRALHALLYGIDARSPDNFLHDHARLRVGAVVQRADGTTVDFIRRKGNKNTFLDRAGNPADDAPLRVALNAVGEDLFTSLFGLTHERLVAGGRGILQARGEVGESLFSAGFSGVSLRDVLDKLEGEAAALFKPQGQNQLINQACRQFKEAKDKIATHSLLSRDYEDRTAELTSLMQTRDQIAVEVKTLRRETNRLERIARALPQLPVRRALLAELAQIGAVPFLSEGFSERRLSACAALDAGRQGGKANEAQIATLAARIAGLSVPETLLAREPIITALHQRLGSHLKAAGDLPALHAERRTLEKAVANLRADLEIDEADTSRPGRGSRQKIQGLVGQHQALVEKALTADRLAQDLSRDLAIQREEQRKLPDVTALRNAVDDIQRRGDLEENLVGHRANLSSAETTAAEALKRLDLWRGTLAELVVFPAPTAETIDRVEKSWLAAQIGLTQTRERQQDLAARAVQNERKIEALLRGGAVPSEAELATARAHRETGWQAIRHAWLAAPGKSTGWDSLAADHEASIGHADDLADRLRRDAARVAEHAQLAAETADLNRERDSLQTELANRQEEMQQLQTVWRKLWPTLEPLPPREMRAWVQKQAQLIAQADGLRGLRATVAATETRIAESRAMLTTHLPNPGEQTLRALVALGQRWITKADLLERDLEKLARESKAAQAAKASADAALAEWKTTWREAMSEIGRSETVTPGEASDFIVGCADLQKEMEKAERVWARINAIRNDAEKFTAEVAEIFTQLSPERDVPKAEEAIGELYARLNRAKQDATTLAELTKQHTAATDGFARAQRAVTDAESILAALCHEAGCEEVTHLEGIERRSRDAKSLRARLEQCDERLLAESAGAPLEAFIAEIESLDADQVPSEINENQRRLGEHDTWHTELSTQIGGLERDVKAMDGNARALEAAEEAQSVLAQLEEHTERFIRLKLAAAILRREIEEYRVKNQSPLLARASEFFRQLTIGSFASVSTDFDEEDNPVLEAVRATGQRVKVESLSDGTRDQLFLALKLATIEKFIANCEPMPFIVDDVLVGFDHEREAAVFGALRELAKKTQVIVFTHHRHLVDSAQQILADGVKVHDLNALRQSADSARLPVAPAGV